MTKTLKTPLWLACVALALTSGALAAQEVEPQTPAPVEDLLYARPFELAQGYLWSPAADEPETRRGVIVVLRVDPGLVVPRNAPTPILYAGDRMIQALNTGYPSGHVVALIPGDVDLSATLMWFGPPRVPAAVTRESIREDRAVAERAEIRPFPREHIDEVTREPVEAENLEALLRRQLADLVLEYAPDEGRLARKWQLPEARAEPDSTQPGAVVRPGAERKQD